MGSSASLKAQLDEFQFHLLAIEEEEQALFSFFSTELLVPETVFATLSFRGFCDNLRVSQTVIPFFILSLEWYKVLCISMLKSDKKGQRVPAQLTSLFLWLSTSLSGVNVFSREYRLASTEQYGKPFWRERSNHSRLTTEDRRVGGGWGRWKGSEDS